jgi:hypothetical protein
MLFKCEQCGIKFIGKESYHIYKFCSYKCYHQSLIGRPSKKRKEKIFRTGYYYIFKPEHPNSGKQGYVAEHRLVMEDYLGRYLTRSEVVHHVNHIITDNRIDNLQLFSSPGQHIMQGHPEVVRKMRLTQFKKGHNR